MEQIDVMRRHPLPRQLGQVQTGIQVIFGVPGTVLLADLAALQGHRGSERRHGHGGDPARAAEIHHGARKQRRQVQRLVLQHVDAGVVRIQTGVVVHVHRGEYLALRHALHHIPHGLRLHAGLDLSARPHPVVIGLLGQVPQPLRRRRGIGDEQAQLARQVQPVVCRVAQQQAPHGIPAGGLVAMHQHRHEQGRGAPTRQMDERRSSEALVQLACVQLQQAFGQFVQFLQDTHISHSCTGRPSDCRSA